MARPALRLRLAPKFPASVSATDGVSVTRSGGAYVFRQDWSNIQQEILPPDPENYEFLFLGSDGSFIRVPADELILPVVTWSTLDGKPSTFPPSAHTHPISEVELLQAALDAKVGTSDTIAANRGGTGQTSYTVGDLLYASGATALSKLPAGTSTYVLTSNGAGVAPTWEAPPATPAGSVVKSAMTQYTTFQSGSTNMAGGNDTVPQITDGSEITTLAFTPTSATNLLRVTVTGNYAASALSNLFAGLFRDATSAAKASTILSVPTIETPLSFILQFEETAGSTSATTYRLRIGGFTGSTPTWAVNGISSARRLGGSTRVVIKIEEIKV